MTQKLRLRDLKKNEKCRGGLACSPAIWSDLLVIDHRKSSLLPHQAHLHLLICRNSG